MTDKKDENGKEEKAMTTMKEKDLLDSIPDNEGFKERITPKDPDDDELILFKCIKETGTGPNKKKCGNLHFRHAGYIELLVPFMLGGKKKKHEIQKQSLIVQVCTKCKACYIWHDNQMYDMTDKIDLEAWEKAEIELNKATGPGGEC